MNFCIARSPIAILYDDVHRLRHTLPNAAGIFVQGPSDLVVETGIAPNVSNIATVDAVAQSLRINWPASAGYTLELAHVNEHLAKLGLPALREDDLPFRV